jgi:ADP-ribosylglycohydrolase
MQSEEIFRDKIKGMFAGHHLGDALGAPYEFYKWNRNTIYTDKLEIRPYRQRDPRHFSKDERHLYQPVGTVTDDTQMTIALMKSIIKNKGIYNWEDAVISYSNWTHSGALDIGTNTRFLFTNKTVKGYQSRVSKRDKEIKKGTRQISLANGALMRCTPLVLLDNWYKDSITDTELTNPYPDIISINIIYLWVLRYIIMGTDIDEIIENAKHIGMIYATNNVYKILIQALNDKIDIDISGKDKGLAIYGFYCAIRSLVLIKKGYNYPEIIRWIITQGTETGKGDTDTNAAIAGAYIGAYFGINNLLSNEITRNNLEILLKTAGDVKGPLLKYVPHDFDELIENYINSLRISNNIDTSKKPIIPYDDNAYNGMIKAHYYFINHYFEDKKKGFIFPFTDKSLYSILGMNLITSHHSMSDIIKKLTIIIEDYSAEKSSVHNAVNSILSGVKLGDNGDNLYYAICGFLLLTYQPEYTIDNIIKILLENNVTQDQILSVVLLIGAYKGLKKLKKEL